ncbi:MAG: helix-turn-helix transcriptional regulator [Alloalcanivorax venustensis]|uniref:helix-turn-helix domain-containing protein n=1 Tax=Gammaproteobacteria TaxID=1236 RepID=UPI00329A6890
MNLGFAIEECRKLKRVTKSQLANDAGLSVSYLSQIISGQREPPISTIEKISGSLGIPSSLLVFLASEDSELSNLSEGMKSEIKRLSKELIEASAERTSNSKIFGE